MTLRRLVLALPLALLGCFNDPVIEVDAASYPVVDAGETDVVAAKDVGFDVGNLDAVTPRDVASDADVVAEAAVDAGPRCVTSADCTGGARCGPDGTCVECVPSDDRCPAAQHCDTTTLTCVPGCRADEGCTASARPDGGTAPPRCDLTRHLCLDCDVDDDCPVRTVCRMGQCLAGCDEQRGCGPGEVCCTGSCVDVQADVGNCGACGTHCATHNGVPGCAAGVCGIESCSVGFADCNHDLTDGCEADLQSDPARCGGCDVSCPTPAGSVGACGGGRCGFTCAAGQADCDGSAANGCERAVASDPGNCGRCNNACPARVGASVPTCEMGTCGARCDVGRADCDGDAANGCETNTRTSLANCGACHAACAPPPNATATCALGRCGFTCNAGYSDCNGDAADGCEVDLQGSPTNCGRCGGVCIVTGGIPACIDGACTIATCGGNFANCDGNTANGCETDTRSTPANCGACGHACPSAAHSTATCAAGVCGSRCATGYGDCDGNAANGCERALTSDVANCGRCGAVCTVVDGTSACSAGVCAVTGCGAGRGNCDGIASNGCETDLTTSAANCGACGVAGVEVCDGHDNSCNGASDEGCPTALGGLTGVDFTSAEFGSGNLPSMDANCPAGQVARGVFGLGTGVVVTTMNVICGTPNLVEDRAVTPYRYNVTLAGNNEVGALGGGTLGTMPYRLVCPGDSVVTGISGSQGPYIYQLTLACSTLSLTGSPGSFRVTTTAASPSPTWSAAAVMGTAFSYSCPANASGSASGLRGLFGRSTNIFGTLTLLSSVGARCAVPAITVR